MKIQIRDTQWKGRMRPLVQAMWLDNGGVDLRIKKGEGGLREICTVRHVCRVNSGILGPKQDRANNGRICVCCVWIWGKNQLCR